MTVARVVVLRARFGLLLRPAHSVGVVDHHELAHQTLVLVQQQMAVIHVRGGVVCVILKPHDQPVISSWLEVHRVLTARKLRWWW
jgi:hypothetical protein